MADAYPNLDNDALLAEIAAYREAIRGVALGGGVREVSGEGRKLVLNGANIAVAKAELRELLHCAAYRGLADTGGGGSLLVEIG